MYYLIVIFVAVGVLGIVIWLIVSAIHASNPGASDCSTSSGEVSGSGHHQSHDSSDSGSSESGGGGD